MRIWAVILLIVFPTWAEGAVCSYIFLKQPTLEDYWVKTKTNALTFAEIDLVIEQLDIPHELRQNLLFAILSGLNKKKVQESRDHFLLLLSQYLGRYAGIKNDPSKKYKMITNITAHLSKIKYGFYVKGEDAGFPEYFYPDGERLRYFYEKGHFRFDGNGKLHRELLGSADIHEVILLLDLPIELKLEFAAAIERGVATVEMFDRRSTTHHSEGFHRGLSAYMATLAGSENIPDLMDNVTESVKNAIPLLKKGELPPAEVIFQDW